MGRTAPIRAAALTLALLLPAAIGCRPDEGPPPSVDVVALVDGDAITAPELALALERGKREAENLSPRTAEELDSARRQTLQDLIDEKLVLHAARAAKVSVPPERVERELLRIKSEYAGPSFEQSLSESGLSLDEFRERLRVRLTTEAWLSGQLFSRIAVTDAELERWFAAHTAEFARTEEVHALQIHVEDAETARKVLAELPKKGQRFEELARRFSRSPDARIGGDLGWFPRGRMPQVFDDVCFSLAPGKVSDVVASPYGFHLFKVLERRAAQAPTLAEVRPLAEKRLRRERETEAQAQELERLRKLATITVREQVLARVTAGTTPPRPTP